MMSPEQKTRIDKAGDEELWRLLSGPPADDVETIYIRERLARRAQAETQRKLDEMAVRMAQVEQSLDRSSLGTPTFWLALTAAVFASFSVPWDSVEERMNEWSVRAQRTLEAPASKRPFRGSPTTSYEPPLPPEDPLSPLSDALLLLPRSDAKPRAIPGF